MKRYIALSLVVLMALSAISTIGVVTTTKAEAAKKPAPTPPPTYYTIVYGTNQQWTAQQLNFHVVYVDPTTTAQHTETSTGNTAAVTLSAQAAEAGENEASVGVQWLLTGINDWTAVQGQHVAVTVTMQYTLKVSNNKYQNGTAAGVTGPTAVNLIMYNGNVQQRVTQTFTQNEMGDPLTIADLTPNGAAGDYRGSFAVAAWNGILSNPSPSQASASVTVSSVSLQYLA
ncbi:MAG: hypothetical protein ACXV4C_09050 [Halobacteriota archaeon]